MTTDEIDLIVPIELEALVVNDQVRYSQNFQRWVMNYNNLTKFLSPEPKPFSSNTASNWRNEPQANGVYLHWTLPTALRHGIQFQQQDQVSFALVPNRWFILRYSGDLTQRTATAWVIQSDYMSSSSGTSSFVDPFKNTVTPTKIGKAWEISQWQEPGGKLFLTAMGPGDVTFTAYQPYVDNVFSFQDPLTGIADQDTLSYLVIGWYSDPSQDILQLMPTGFDFYQWLQVLDWDISETGNYADQSIYEGLIYGVSWNKTGSVPTSNKPNPNNVTVSLGNTSIDALTALIQSQLPGTGSDIDPELLQAFQYGLLSEMSQSKGINTLAEKIFQAWFNQSNGGYIWEIVDRPTDIPATTGLENSISAAELEKEERWLADLNQKQQLFDEQFRVLQSLQYELFSVWWKQGFLPNLPIWPNYPTGTSKQLFDDAFDPDLTDSLISQVYAQIEYVNTLQSQIPWGDTQEELQISILAYAAEQELPDIRELKRSNKQRFWNPNNPVMLFHGLNSDITVDPNISVSCRFPSQLIYGLTFQSQNITDSSMAGKIPTVDLSKVPNIIADLINEFFFLDPNNATMIATTALGNPSLAPQVQQVMENHTSNLGTLPDQSIIPLQTWQQPWSPLLLLADVVWYPIDYAETGGPNWDFDGEQFIWNGQGANITNSPTHFFSRIFLTPQAQFNLKKRLQQYLEEYPNADLELVTDFIQQVDGWDFLSQTIDGLQQQLLQRIPLSALSPDDSHIYIPTDWTLAKLVAGNNLYAPDPGAYEKQPFSGWPESVFKGLRSGQFYFYRLSIVDRFGQALEVVTSSSQTQFKPILAPDLKPEKTVIPQEPDRFVQLTPRLLQPARLYFNYVSCMDDHKPINLDAGTNPICAWILPNHLDRGLTCYSNLGTLLGEVRVITTIQATQEVYWFGAPNSPYQRLVDLESDFPHLYSMLSYFNETGIEGSQAFYNFLETIDETLWSIDPLGARDDQFLSVLIGRPLALCRAQLQFNLFGPPVTDPTWRFTFNPQPAEYINNIFNVYLGNIELWRDGLIGFYVGDDYNHFIASHMPDGMPPANPPYILPSSDNPIDLTLEENSEAFVSMLIDPRASVHAYGGITPPAQLNLPQQFVNEALENMEATFKIGPLLCQTRTSIGDITGMETDQLTGIDHETVLLPKPSEKNGYWAWMQFDGQFWQSFPIASTDQQASFSNESPKLRTGLLQLSQALKPITE